MKFFQWLRGGHIEVVKEAKSGYTYVFEGHDQSKGAQAFARSKAEALAIRRNARVDSRAVLRVVGRAR